MLKSFFILIFSISIGYANSVIEKGDIQYVKNNYIDAIVFYEKAYKQKHPKAKLKLIMSYLKLGANFERIKNYDKALSWYKNAVKLKSNIAKSKISNIYEKQADDYNRIKKYKTALNLYKKALKLGNSKVTSKIKTIQNKLNHKKKLKNDTRKLVDKKSPPWTKAIGRLIIPTKLQFISNKKYKTKYKKCSASLVDFKDSKSSKVIVTASHCLTAYNKKAGDLRFIIQTSAGDMIQKIAKIYKDSKYSSKKLKTNSDYAILTLNTPIKRNEVKPFIINKSSFVNLKKRYKNSFGSLAGFSGDIGEYGAKLTYDPECRLNYYSKTYGSSNCIGFKGASGGPVVLTTIDKNQNYRYNFVGVVSHFRKKEFKKIFFAPHHLFFKDLKKAINKYNY